MAAADSKGWMGQLRHRISPPDFRLMLYRDARPFVMQNVDSGIKVAAISAFGRSHVGQKQTLTQLCSPGGVDLECSEDDTVAAFRVENFQAGG